MRLLHTSDWHLGQSLHQFDRTAEHQHFLRWLVETLDQQRIDVLLVAGDIFDNANPSTSAQALLNQFLTEARRRVPHLQIVLTAGNHDSPGRLDALSPLLNWIDATVVGSLPYGKTGHDWSRCVLPLRNRQGDPAAWCIALPFLRPTDLPAQPQTEQPYLEGMQRIYQEAIAYARAQSAPGQALIAMGHCHVRGGQTSEHSERNLLIGGAEALPTSLFPADLAYVALGHLHLAQQLDQNPSRRYSGSPLPLSFAETHYPHQVVCIELDGANVKSIDTLAVPRHVELLRLPSQAAPLADVLRQLESLQPSALAPEQWPYLLVRVLLTEPEPHLRQQIEQALSGKPVRLARIEVSYQQTDLFAAPLHHSLDDLVALQPQDFFERLYQHHYGETVPEPLLNAFNSLVLQLSHKDSA